MKRRKIKNFVLKAMACIMFLAWAVSGCLLDSASWIPGAVCIGSFAWLMLFAYANGAFDYEEDER